MRAPSKGNRSCPVLLNDGGDYSERECHFILRSVKDPVIDGKDGDQLVHVFLDVDIECPPLQTLIDNGNAKIIIFLEQKTTRQSRDYYKGFEWSFSPYDFQFGKNIQIMAAVVGTKNTVLPYSADYMDDLYSFFQEDGFPVIPGEYLGYSNNVDLETREIKGLSSFFDIQCMDKADKTKPFLIDFDGDKIVVKLNPTLSKDLQYYQSSISTHNAMMNSCLVYPAIYQAIMTILIDPVGYKDTMWFDALTSKINQRLVESKQDEYDFGQACKKDDLVTTAWELTSLLLTDENGPMMVKGFEDLNSFAKGE